MKIPLKMVLLIALCAVYACKHEVGETNNIFGGQDCSYSIKYDAEITMTLQVANSADMNRLTPQDRVGLMPHTTRTAVDFCLKKDGTSEWLIEKKKPQQVFEAKSYTLPDPSPKSKTIRIKNDKAIFIGADGKVIRETDFKVDALTSSLKEIMRLANGSSSSEDFDKMLSDARKDGALIQDLGDGVFSLTKQLTTSPEKVTVTIDKTIGRIIGNAVKDVNGKLRYAVIYNYERGNTPILKNVIQRGYKTTASGISMVSQKMIQFHKLEMSGTFKNANASGLY